MVVFRKSPCRIGIVQRILEAINPNTRLVAIGQVHWADGTLFQLKQIRARTREIGSLLVIDASQSVGAFPFDTTEIDPDAMISAAYKWMLGPYSIGLGYYGPYFDQGEPIEHSWLNRLESQDFQGLVKYQELYQPGSLRYEVGEHSNFILVPMLTQAIRQINQWGVDNIQKYCQRLSKDVLKEISELGFWIEDSQNRGQHLVGISNCSLHFF